MQAACGAGTTPRTAPRAPPDAARDAGPAAHGERGRGPHAAMPRTCPAGDGRSADAAGGLLSTAAPRLAAPLNEPGHTPAVDTPSAVDTAPPPPAVIKVSQPAEDTAPQPDGHAPADEVPMATADKGPPAADKGTDKDVVAGRAAAHMPLQSDPVAVAAAGGAVDTIAVGRATLLTAARAVDKDRVVEREATVQVRRHRDEC